MTYNVEELIAELQKVKDKKQMVKIRSLRLDPDGFWAQPPVGAGSGIFSIHEEGYSLIIEYE